METRTKSLLTVLVAVCFAALLLATRAHRSTVMVTLTMRNTSWNLKIREAYMSKDRTHVDVVAELIEPRTAAVGRAFSSPGDTVALAEPELPVQAWVFVTKDWHRGQIAKIPDGTRVVSAEDPALLGVRQGERLYP